MFGPFTTFLCLKMNSTLLGEVTLLFTYFILFSRGFTLKGKNLLLLEQILSFKSKPQFGRAMEGRKANRKSWKLFPLVKMTEKHWGVPIHLNCLMKHYGTWKAFCSPLLILTTLRSAFSSSNMDTKFSLLFPFKVFPNMLPAAFAIICTSFRSST